MHAHTDHPKTKCVGHLIAGRIIQTYANNC